MVQKAVVDVGGFCTGTLIRPDWVMTARHCTHIDQITVVHNPTGASRTVTSANY